ncbi:MAG: nitroreductase family protein [Thermoplasmata archaeon]
MELGEAIRRRRMVRSFLPDPLERGVVDRLLEDSLRAPSAGNTRGVAWVVLEGPETARYWDVATDAEWRRSYARYPNLSRVPVIALSLCSPTEYVERYSESDKAGSGLGIGESDDPATAWPVPYWWGDAAMSTMLLLLGATAEGLGAAFLGTFRGEQDLLAGLGVPVGWRVFGAVLLGRPDGQDRPSPSLGRQPRPGASEVHRSRW